MIASAVMLRWGILRRRWRAIVAAVMAQSCGGEDVIDLPWQPPPPDEEPCGIPNRMLEDGRCIEPGVQDSGCPAGTLTLADGSCQPAGIPPALCAPGFEPANGSCEPVLPPDACTGDTVAFIGEATCHELVACGSGTWGNVPIDATTQHVDAAYVGGNNTGSVAAPWTAIGQAVAAAAPGAIVAVAAGSYVEDVLIEGKPVRLWGRCPRQVEVVGSTFAAVTVRAGADGSEVRGIAAGGAAMGIAVSGSQGVLVQDVWAHGAAGRGVDVENTLGPTSVTLRTLLVDGATEMGVYLSGVTADVERLVVRGTVTDSASGLARGVAFESGASDQRSSLALHDSLLERNEGLGLFGVGSDATIDVSVVRHTLPHPDQTRGRGVAIQAHASAGASNVAVNGSSVEHSRDVGVFVLGSVMSLEASRVAHTEPTAIDGSDGIGVDVENDLATGLRSEARLRSVMIEDAHKLGLYVIGSDAVVEGIVVRGVAPQASDQTLGRGINVEDDTGVSASAAIVGSIVEGAHDIGLAAFGATLGADGIVVRGTAAQMLDDTGGDGVVLQDNLDTGGTIAATLFGSLIEQNHTMGVRVGGGHAVIEGVVVRATSAEPASQKFGRGIAIQGALAASTTTVRSSLVEDSVEVGVFALQSAFFLERTVVRRTSPRLLDGRLGDGVVLLDNLGTTPAALARSRITDSARAGVAAFGAVGTLAETEILCNAIALTLQSFAEASARLDDAGGNRCGCGEIVEVCKTNPIGLEPPEPLDPVQ